MNTPYPYELATPEQRALGTWWIAVHHEVLCETLTEPVEVRVAYIRAQKPADEIETRLRALRPASPAMVAAWAEVERVTALAGAEFERVTALARAEFERVTALAGAEVERVTALAQAEFDRVTAPARAEVERVTAVECPDLAWGPDGLVFPVADTQTEAPHAG